MKYPAAYVTYDPIHRNKQRAEALAAALGRGAEAAELAAVRDATVFGDVLVNTTSVGMSPGDDESPVPHSALAGFRLVFDAVYTPPQTRLLKVAIPSASVPYIKPPQNGKH